MDVRGGERESRGYEPIPVRSFSHLAAAWMESVQRERDAMNDDAAECAHHETIGAAVCLTKSKVSQISEAVAALAVAKVAIGEESDYKLALAMIEQAGEFLAVIEKETRPCAI